MVIDGVEIHKANINSFWGYLIIEELVRNNISHFCLSPGSRSTPLAVAVAKNKRVNVLICYDERSAAYNALGYARASGKPAVLICTSGSAAANYFPAIIEAHQSAIPLIMLTADRPPELRDTGANQTIDQIKMYSNYLNWQFDLPCPDKKIVAQFVLTTIDQAVYRAKRQPAGPVHINCMFREPLAPRVEALSDSYLASIAGWEEKCEPHTDYSPCSVTTAKEVLKALAQKLNTSDKGVLAIGRLKSKEQATAVLKFAQHIGWPVFADVTSGMRNKNTSTIINNFDQLLLSEYFAEVAKPEAILHIGPPLTSKRFLDFINRYPVQEYLVVADHPFRHDPNHLVTRRFEHNITDFCDQMISLTKHNQNERWIKDLINYDTTINKEIDLFVKSTHNISEISLARIISQTIPKEHGLFLASSMPVRDMDMYGDFTQPHFYIAANRGVSGIDGTISSALGYACGLNKPVTVVVGDLAMIHDLNALSQIKQVDVKLIIVVINNHGGGIFSFLPIADFPDVFEKYFATPHTISFKYAAELFQLDYNLVKTNEEFVSLYRDAVTSNRSLLLEVVTKRDENSEMHRTLQKRIRNTIDKLKP